MHCLRRTKYPEDLKKDLEKSLRRFDFISVREKTGLDIVRDTGVNEAFLVPDPTLLLKKEDYTKFVKETKRENDYTFLYMLGNHKKMLMRLWNTPKGKALML